MFHLYKKRYKYIYASYTISISRRTQNELFVTSYWLSPGRGTFHHKPFLVCLHFLKKSSIFRKIFWCYPYRILADFFVEGDKLILNYIWNSRRPQRANLKKEQSRTCLPQFQNLLQSNNNQCSNGIRIDIQIIKKKN